MSDLLLEKINKELSSLSEEDKNAFMERLQSQLSDTHESLLSNAQMRLWFLEQFNHCPYLYHIPFSMVLTEDIDTTLLETALRKVIADEPALTRYFVNEEGQTKGYQPAECHFSIQEFDLSYELPSFMEVSAASPLASFYLDAFQFDKSPLFRIAFAKAREKKYLLMCFHHLIIDGWSLNLFIQKTYQYYQELIAQSESIYDAPPYSTFIAWEQTNNQISSAGKINYWLERLVNKSMVIDLITDHPRQALQSGKGKTIFQPIPADLVDTLTECAKSIGVSLNQCFLFAFQFMLSRYSGQDQITVGIPVAGRPHARWYKTMGLFVNTCLHTTKLLYQSSIKDHLHEGKKDLHNDIVNLLPYEEIVKHLYSHQQLQPGPAFNVLYNFIQIDKEQFDISKSLGQMQYCVLPVSKFDLSLHTYVSERNVDLFFEFNTDIYNEKTINQMIQYFLKILKTMPLFMMESLNSWVWALTAE